MGVDPVRAAGTHGPCVGCGGCVPSVDGPTHAYMQASSGCWQVYGELGVRLMRAGTFHVDCYAVQHPGGAAGDRRQRRSVAVHLVMLCLLLEHGLAPQRAAVLRGTMSDRVLPRLGLQDWPLLEPPDDVGAITAVDVARAAAPPGHVGEWTRSAWATWGAHHDTVRAWAKAAAAS